MNSARAQDDTDRRPDLDLSAGGAYLELPRTYDLPKRFALSRGFRIGMFRGHTAMVVGFRRTEPAERRCEPAFTRSLDAFNALVFDSDLFIPARLAGVWRN